MNSFSLAALLAVSVAAVQPPPLERLIAGRVTEYFAAMGRGDLATVEQMLADDYMVVGVDGKFENRTERLRWLKANPGIVANVTPSEIQVRIYGATAVVSGLVSIPPDGKEPAVTERFTQVWVKGQGTWRVVSGQITKVLGPGIRP